MSIEFKATTDGPYGVQNKGSISASKEPDWHLFSANQEEPVVLQGPPATAVYVTKDDLAKIEQWKKQGLAINPPIAGYTNPPSAFGQ